MKNACQSFIKWFRNDNPNFEAISEYTKKVEWFRVIPFLLMHAACLLVVFVGFSWTAFYVAIFLYYLRIFSVTAFYHRYFSHRAYKTSRVMQFIFACLGCSAVQRGPLWWASHHRQHHRVSDQAEDQHSPVVHGFLWSHMGWFMSKQGYCYDPSKVKDIAKFPELRFLDRYDIFVPIVLAILLFMLGHYLAGAYPLLKTSGSQMLIWGFFISTVCVFHTTAVVNSLSHKFGKRPYATKDDSRNNLFLALLTFGEGWHNNHHHYPASVRQGFRWWEIDITFYILKLFEKMGLIWELRYPPSSK